MTKEEIIKKKNIKWVDGVGKEVEMIKKEKDPMDEITVAEYLKCEIERSTRHLMEFIGEEATKDFIKELFSKY